MGPQNHTASSEFVLCTYMGTETLLCLAMTKSLFDSTACMEQLVVFCFNGRHTQRTEPKGTDSAGWNRKF